MQEPQLVDHLVSIRRTIIEESDPGDWLVLTAVHLIDCATDVVALLSDRDLSDRKVDSAQEALGAARAAVTTATMAVRDVRDLAGGNPA